MVKTTAKIRFLLSGAIIISIIAFACFAFAADTQDNPLIGNDDAYIMDRQYSASAPPSFDPNTGWFSYPGYEPIAVAVDLLASKEGVAYQVSYMLRGADAFGLANYDSAGRLLSNSFNSQLATATPLGGVAGVNPSVAPPPVNSGLNPSSTPATGNPGSFSEPSYTPHISTPSVWTYTPPTPAVPRNYQLITIMLPKAQIILGSDFIKRAPDRFLASTLVKLISQITMNSPNINIPGLYASGINDSPLIAVVTPRGIAIYAPPANLGINTDQPVNSSLAPSVRIISGPDYMRLPETGFITVSVGDIQATAPVTEDVSIPALKPVNSRLPGYTVEMTDSSYITVVVTPTAVIYMPANKVDIEDAPQARSPLAVTRLENKTQIPEITISAPVWADDTIKLPENASAAPIAQIILGVESIKISEDGVISIDTADIKATAPAADVTQLPDAPNIAVAITPDGMVYMPDPQTIAPAKNPAMPDQKTKTQIPEITISAPVWVEDTTKLPETASVVPLAEIVLDADLIKIADDGSILIDTEDIKATAPAVDTAQMPDSINIAVAITPDGAIYMPDPQTITLAKQAIKYKVSDSINQPPADALPIVWAVVQTTPKEANKPDVEIPVENSKKSIEKPAVQDIKKPAKAIDVKAFIAKANQAIVAKTQAFKAKQTIAAKKLTKMLAIQARNITKKTASFVKDRFVAAKKSISDTRKTIAQYIKFAKNAGSKAAGYINKFIKGLIQALKILGPNEETPVFILDRNTLPIAAMDRQNDPFGPPLQKIQVKDLTGDPAPFGSLISRAIPNRINNANMFFVDIIKKNAVNYAHTGLSPPQTVSPNSTAFLSALNGSVSADSAFVAPANLADFSLFFVNILNKTVSLSLLNAYAFNFEARDFCLFNNLFKKGGTHD